MESRKLNFKPSPPDSRDFIIKIDHDKLKALNVKSKVDLSPYCTSVKDQGSVGACTAFAGAGAMEYLQKKYNAAKDDDIYSERFLYYATRVNTEQQPATEDNGAYIRDVIKTVVKYGVCKESTFPFNGDYKMTPPQLAYDEATKFQVLKYGKFQDGTNTTDRAKFIQDIKANLELGFPVMVGFTCFENLYDTKSDGIVPLPSGQIIGGHAVLLVGYDDEKQLFKFKNSWTTNWGDSGYGYLPYQYYLSGHMSDCWSIFMEEDNDLKHIGVDVVPNPTPVDQRLTDVKSILTTILGRVSALTDINKLPTTCTDLVNKYQKEGNVKMYSLVANMKSQFKYIIKP